MSDQTPGVTPDRDPDPSPDRTGAAGQATTSGDRAQYGMCAALAVLGIVLIVDATRLAPMQTSNDPMGPRPVPIVLGILMLVVAVLYAIDIRRGGVGASDEGEDVDLTARADWKTVGLLLVVFGVSAALIEPLGWVIAGSLLFWGCSFALGNRHHIRGLLIGIAISLITFYAFAIGLGVNLPAGILQGIL
ncbi:MAG: tripartite tricarboxylate transporter TctB family protein [Intrasporangium sp.]|uniref:tripartite tricarboxylate transporter TctB family protein n=1 Tax=Intrasporangium sp. TaxID=1925024 RepID=UPI002647A54C|nr:tripartite tricarboxylate transporter TctB family protein [Intrasporangium sp.]MDN5796739.1 tripartite tricarboxylate transporter TctB family protein [Intrasporangium sp.]